MKFTIKRFFTLALLTVGLASNSLVHAYCDVELVLERKLEYLLASTTNEVKAWRAWVEDIIKEIPNTEKNSDLIKELEFIKRFSSTTAIGARLESKKHLYPTKIVDLLTKKFTKAQILEILDLRTGKKKI